MLPAVPPQATPDEAPWSPRPEAELLQDQVVAIDAWVQARCQEAASARDLAAASREERLDLARRADVVRRQHEALVARTQEQLRSSAHLLRSAPAPRAVVVHRDAWFRDKVCRGLTDGGVEVVASLDNGADAVGTVVAEQPDLLLVEDKLPMLGGAEVLREVRRFAPRTLAAVHVGGDGPVAGLLAEGACATYPRRTTPAAVAADLCGRVSV